MRVVYTDRYAFQLWALGYIVLSSGYSALNAAGPWHVLFSGSGVIVGGGLFAWELRRRIIAKRQGRDPSIVRIVDSASN
jgi:hypothetical protein